MTVLDNGFLGHPVLYTTQLFISSATYVLI